eukprot:jgi/Botrbrau1/7311/Bobra.247_3s0006.1
MRIVHCPGNLSVMLALLSGCQYFLPPPPHPFPPNANSRSARVCHWARSCAWFVTPGHILALCTVETVDATMFSTPNISWLSALLRQ